MKSNTRIIYLYRDGANYKLINDAVVAGAISDDQKARIAESLLDGESFIPHIVGLPERTFTDLGYAANEDDTPFFELDMNTAFELTDEEPTVPDLDVNALTERFVMAADQWEIQAEKVDGMTIHFYVDQPPCGFPPNVIHDYVTVRKMIENRVEKIQTTQMCELSTNLFTLGYRVFLISKGKETEIRLNDKLPNSKRILRSNHKLLRLFQAGEIVKM